MRQPHWLILKCDVENSRIHCDLEKNQPWELDSPEPDQLIEICPKVNAINIFYVNIDPPCGHHFLMFRRCEHDLEL